jgi:hypothetical protein
MCTKGHVKKAIREARQHHKSGSTMFIHSQTQTNTVSAATTRSVVLAPVNRSLEASAIAVGTPTDV